LGRGRGISQYRSDSGRSELLALQKRKRRIVGKEDSGGSFGPEKVAGLGGQVLQDLVFLPLTFSEGINAILCADAGSEWPWNDSVNAAATAEEMGTWTYRRHMGGVPDIERRRIEPQNQWAVGRRNDDF